MNKWDLTQSELLYTREGSWNNFEILSRNERKFLGKGNYMNRKGEKFTVYQRTKYD